MMDRISLRETILDCTACELHERCTAPVPWSGPEDAEIVVMGEAPGKQEDHFGEPFIGPAGELLRSVLSEVGLDPTQIAYINTVSCFPNATPTFEQVDACAHNKQLQLELVQPKYVILVGKVALKGALRVLDLKHGRARPFLEPAGRWIQWATYHPAAALRNGVYAEAMREDLTRFMEMRASEKPTTFVPDNCACCTIDAEWFDPSWLGWCDMHMPTEVREARDRHKRLLELEFAEAKARLADG